MLIYRDGMFVQSLEGKKESVINIYGYIALDIRHDCIKTIYKTIAQMSEYLKIRRLGFFVLIMIPFLNL